MSAGLYNTVFKHSGCMAGILGLMGYYLTHPWSILKWHPQVRFEQITGKKNKGTDDPVHAMNAYGRCRGTARILNFGTVWVLSGLTPGPGRFTVGEKAPPPSPKPTKQGVGGSRSQSGRFWRTEVPVIPRRNRTPNRPTGNIYSYNRDTT